MAWNGVSLIEITDGEAQSAEQDQIAHICRLILLYSLYSIYLWLHTVTISVKS